MSSVRAAASGEPHGLRDRQTVVLLFGLAVAVRAITAVRTAVIFADGPSFVELAERIAVGDWDAALRHPYHPMYPALMAIGRLFAGDLETAGIVWSILGGSLAVVGLYAFLRDAFDARVAWIGALFLAVGPYAVRFSSDVQSDGVYLGCFLIGVALLWRALDRATPVAALGAGALAGLAYLTRPEGVGIVVVGGFLAGLKWLGHRWSGKQLVRWLAALGTGFAALALPYLWGLSTVNGSWMLSGKKSIGALLGVVEAPLAVDSSPGALIGGLALLLLFAIALRRPASGASVSPSARTAWALGALVASGLGVAILVLPAAREYASVVVSSLGPAIALWAGVGLLVKRADRLPQRALFIGAFLGLYGLVLGALLQNYGYLSRRHALPPLALLLGYSAIGTGVLADALRSAARRFAPGRRLSAGWSLVIALAMVSATELPKTLRRHRDDALAQRWAAEWLRAQAMPAGGLAATRQRTAYYAGREWVPLRYGADDPDAGALRLGSASYLIVDHELGPALPGVRSDLVELHRVEAVGKLALVYRIVRERRR